MAQYASNCSVVLCQLRMTSSTWVAFCSDWDDSFPWFCNQCDPSDYELQLREWREMTLAGPGLQLGWGSYHAQAHDKKLFFFFYKLSLIECRRQRQRWSWIKINSFMTEGVRLGFLYELCSGDMCLSQSCKKASSSAHCVTALRLMGFSKKLSDMLRLGCFTVISLSFSCHSIKVALVLPIL